VRRITPRRGPSLAVFNIEVDGEHVYYVGQGGVLVHNAYHHSIPKYLGGDFQQPLTNVSQAIHQQLHSMLRARWRALGLPPEGGINGSYQKWIDHFQNNPGSQRVALQELISVTDQIDQQHGTQLLHDLLTNLWTSQFTYYP
jgi:hypothetical protein